MSYFFKEQLKYQPMIETETADQVLSLVEHNLGVGFFPASAAQEFIDAGRIVKVPLDYPPSCVKRILSITRNGFGVLPP